MISRYLELIRALTSSNTRIKPKTYRLACPILSQKYELWCIPERRQSFTSRSAEVIRIFLNKKKIKVVIGKAKRSFFLTALSSKRPKEVWRVIHRVLNPITNPLRADPDQLNKYLIGTNERTLGTTPDATSDLLELAKSLPEHSQRSFKLGHVTFEDVMKVIRNLRLDCSTGVDQIPVKFVKLVSEHIAGPLTRIIKTCITSSTFPRTCKTARVSSIPKTDHPQSEKGYRPVSILPAISKAFERLELKQLIFYRDFFLLAPSISSFRKGHSTVTALLGIRDDLVRAMKRGEVSLMVFADYSKAFDTVCFKTVLTKMHALGFLDEFLTWMVHYLSDRRQLVQIDDKTSSIETVLVSHRDRYSDLLFSTYMFLIFKNTLSVPVTSTRTIQLSSFTQRRRT